jgi:hypothetical protein
MMELVNSLAGPVLQLTYTLGTTVFTVLVKLKSEGNLFILAVLAHSTTDI